LKYPKIKVEEINEKSLPLGVVYEPRAESFLRHHPSKKPKKIKKFSTLCYTPLMLLDLTHTITSQTPPFPGDPHPELTQTSFIATAGYNEFQIKTGMHIGTHMDAPLHMIPNGKRLSAYPPERFFGTGHLVDARDKVISPDLLEGMKISRGDFVFVCTGFSSKFGTEEYFNDYPEITPAFAEALVSIGVGAVGMDTPSPDRAPFEIHKILLGHDILIIENLANPDHLLPWKNGFKVTALPAKFDTEAAPVRVIVETA